MRTLKIYQYVLKATRLCGYLIKYMSLRISNKLLKKIMFQTSLTVNFFFDYQNISALVTQIIAKNDQFYIYIYPHNILMIS